MRIFLIGMPGSGKSYWGRMLAAHLGYEWLDLDLYIEKREGRSIPEMFAIDEGYFREKEREALQSVTTDFPEDTIVATGGGAPFFEDNMKWMLAKGKVVYLQAQVDYLFNRLKHAYTERPLLKSTTDEELYEKTMQLFEQRKAVYLKAPYIIDVETATIDDFISILNS